MSQRFILNPVAFLGFGEDAFSASLPSKIRKSVASQILRVTVLNSRSRRHPIVREERTVLSRREVYKQCTKPAWADADKWFKGDLGLSRARVSHDKSVTM